MDEFKDFAKKYPGFTALVAVCVLLFIALLAFYFVAKGNADQAKAYYEQSNQMRSRALNYETAPLQENLEKAKANVQYLKDNLAKRKARVSGVDTELMQDIPTDPDKMFFEIKNYIDFYVNEAGKTIRDPYTKEMRTNIEIPANFRFGFGYFIDKTAKGPPQEHIKDVFVQKQVLNFLMEKLFAAMPMSIVSVNRTPVVEDSASLQSTKGGSYTYDLFLVDELTSARQPGAIGTMGFRLVFRGYTSSLQGLLTELPKFPLPLVVRSVEVEPPKVDFNNEKKKKDDDDGDGGLAALFGIEPTESDDEDEEPVINKEKVVDNNVSQYTVILELIRVQEEDTNAKKEDERDGR